MGVVAAVVVVAVVGVVVVAGASAFASVLSDAFSLPTVIVLLEPLEPQPAIERASGERAQRRGGRGERVGGGGS